MIMVFLTLIPASAADPADWPAPDITEVSLKGREVTLAGSGFGKNSGDDGRILADQKIKASCLTCNTDGIHMWER